MINLKPYKLSNLFRTMTLLTILAVISSVVNAAAEIEKTREISNQKSATQKSAKTVVILLGAPGSGKGTQAVKLANELNVPHISTGDILRENIKRNTVLGNKVKVYMDSGKLVPDALISEMVFARIDQPDAVNGYILDGYPRTISQAKDLDKHLANKVQRVVVINLNVSDNKLIDRILKRSTEKGEKRSDDTPEVAKQRLKVYHEQTKPVMTYYKEKGELITIDGEHAPSEVFKEIIEAYKKQK